MNIYVGNLWRQTSEAELQEAFEAYGNVTSVSIIKDKFSGESRGFGFVEMASDQEAQAAIDALHGSSLGGRTLTVNKAKPREERRDDRRGGSSGGGFNRQKRVPNQDRDRGERRW